MRKLTKTYISKQIPLLSNNKCKLIDKAPYKNAHQKFLIKDLVTNKLFKKTWNAFKNRPRSPYWYKDLNIGRHRKWDTKSVSKYIRNNSSHHQYQLEKHLMKKPYQSTKQKLPILHRKPYGCGKVFYMTFDKFKQGERCPYCRYHKIRLSRATMAKKIYYKTNKQYILITKSQPKNVAQKLIFKHIKCGTKFKATYNDFWEMKNKCPHCSKDPHKKLSFSIINKRITKATNGQYKLRLDIIKKKNLRYTNNLAKILPIIHLKCGNTYWTRWCDFHSGHRCPYCNASHGEQITIQWCIKHHIKYIHGYHTDCYMSKQAKKEHKSLHIDVYLPKYHIGIEFNGIEHLVPNAYFNKKHGYGNQVSRDTQKKIWCSKHNITLISINTISTQWNKHDTKMTTLTLNYLIKPLIYNKTKMTR